MLMEHLNGASEENLVKGSHLKLQVHLRETHMGRCHTPGLVIVGTIITAALRGVGATVIGSRRKLEL